jgi:hypothetical protein
MTLLAFSMIPILLVAWAGYVMVNQPSPATIPPPHCHDCGHLSVWAHGRYHTNYGWQCPACDLGEHDEQPIV